MIRDNLARYLPALEYLEVPGACHELEGALLDRLREYVGRLTATS
jgi:hypothetical protein